jgi:predicted transcriptional regulator
VLVKDMKLNLTVHYVCESDNTQTARALMRKHRIGALLVVDSENSPTGIITSHDLLGVDDFSDTPVSLHASSPLLTVTPDDSIRRVSELMVHHHCHHLVVVKGLEVTAMLSSLDIVNFYLQAYSTE